MDRPVARGTYLVGNVICCSCGERYRTVYGLHTSQPMECVHCESYTAYPVGTAFVADVDVEVIEARILLESGDLRRRLLTSRR